MGATGRFIRTALAGLLSAGAAVAIVGWLSKAAVERYADAALERHSESFKHELNRQLTAFSGAVETAEAANRLRFDRMLSHRQQQLSEFYWPIYIRLQSDNAVWERVLGSDDPKRLPPDVRRPMEEFILQNHGEILKIVQSKYHLADHDEHLERLLLQYVRHVTVYQAMRRSGSYDDRVPLDLQEPWPSGLFGRFQERLRAVQRSHDDMLRESAQRVASDSGSPPR